MPYSAPIVETSSPAGAVDLAQRLRDNGAKMYGAFWCGHCFEQKETFGREAQAALPYVECYPNGYEGPQSIAPACKEANIDGFPTWIINGEKLEGDWPLESLEQAVNGAKFEGVRDAQ